MKFHVDRFTVDGWIRIASDLVSMDVAKNMQKALAKANNIDVDNYSILVEVAE